MCNRAHKNSGIATGGVVVTGGIADAGEMLALCNKYLSTSN